MAVDSIYKYLSSLPDKRTSLALSKVFERILPRATEPTSSGVYVDLGAVTATAAELNRATDISARVVTTTATALSLTVTEHADRVVLVNSNTTVANTLTLPVATGSGAKFTVINNIAQTQGSIVIAANGTLDVLKGVAVVSNTSTTVNVQSFLTSASSDKVTWNRTTTGGAGPGDYFEAYDSAANTWTVQVRAGSVGAAATPFSET